MKASITVYHTDEKGIVVDSDYEGDFELDPLEDNIIELKALLINLGLIKDVDEARDIIFHGDELDGYLVTKDDIVNTPLFNIEIIA